MPIMSQGSLRAAGAHDQVDRDARDLALSLGSSGRGVMDRPALPRPDIEPLKRSLFHRLCLSDPSIHVFESTSLLKPPCCLTVSQT